MVLNPYALKENNENLKYFKQNALGVSNKFNIKITFIMNYTYGRPTATSFFNCIDNTFAIISPSARRCKFVERFNRSYSTVRQ